MAAPNGARMWARTDAAGIDGIDAAIERAKAYVDAGADLIFTEALATEADFEKFRAAVVVVLDELIHAQTDVAERAPVGW